MARRKMSEKFRAPAPYSTRGATLELQTKWPIGKRVDFFDKEGHQRIGEIVDHRKGKVVVLSPLHKRNSSITKEMWEQVAERYQVEETSIKGEFNG